MYIVEDKGEDDDEEECEEESSEEDLEEDLSMTEEPGNDSGCTAVVAVLRGQLDFHLQLTYMSKSQPDFYISK